MPVDKLHLSLQWRASYKDLVEDAVRAVVHFFQHYKDLEKGKSVSSRAGSSTLPGDRRR